MQKGFGRTTAQHIQDASAVLHDGKATQLFFGESLSNTVYGRLRRGWSRQTALHLPPHHRLITANGKTQTQAQWARELGIKEQSIFARLARGWSEEEAVTCPARQAPRYLTFEGRTMNISEWARERGLSSGTIQQRLKMGWSVADALSRPINMQFRKRPVR